MKGVNFMKTYYFDKPDRKCRRQKTTSICLGRQLPGDRFVHPDHRLDKSNYALIKTSHHF